MDVSLWCVGPQAKVHNDGLLWSEFLLQEAFQGDYLIEIVVWFSPVACNKRFEWMKNRLELILLVGWNFVWNKDRKVVSVCSLGRSV